MSKHWQFALLEPHALCLQVKCDPVPANATLHCNSVEHPCLFHIPSDPCEHHNVASLYPHHVTILLAKLRIYNSTVVPPRNKPYDPNANPKYWDYSWTNWLDYPPPLSPRVLEEEQMSNDKYFYDIYGDYKNWWIFTFHNVLLYVNELDIESV